MILHRSRRFMMNFKTRAVYVTFPPLLALEAFKEEKENGIP